MFIIWVRKTPFSSPTAQQLFPPSIITIYNFHFVVFNFKAFLFMDVDDFDMMH